MQQQNINKYQRARTDGHQLLPRHQIPFADNKWNQQDGHCPICYNQFNTLSELQCGHRFCNQCISKWLQDKNTCPTCRKQCHKNNIKEVQSNKIPFESTALNTFKNNMHEIISATPTNPTIKQQHNNSDHYYHCASFKTNKKNTLHVLHINNPPQNTHIESLAILLDTSGSMHSPLIEIVKNNEIAKLIQHLFFKNNVTEIRLLFTFFNNHFSTMNDDKSYFYSEQEIKDIIQLTTDNNTIIEWITFLKENQSTATENDQEQMPQVFTFKKTMPRDEIEEKFSNNEEGKQQCILQQQIHLFKCAQYICAIHKKCTAGGGTYLNRGIQGLTEAIKRNFSTQKDNVIALITTDGATMMPSESREAFNQLICQPHIQPAFLACGNDLDIEDCHQIIATNPECFTHDPNPSNMFKKYLNTRGDIANIGGAFIKGNYTNIINGQKCNKGTYIRGNRIYLLGNETFQIQNAEDEPIQHRYAAEFIFTENHLQQLIPSFVANLIHQGLQEKQHGKYHLHSVLTHAIDFLNNIINKTNMKREIKQAIGTLTNHATSLKNAPSYSIMTMTMGREASQTMRRTATGRK